MSASPSVETNPTVNSTENPSSIANPRIDEVEKEVKKLKADVDNFMELKNTVDDLKNTIVDIRALMSKTQSPYDLLQFITDEDDLKKVVQPRPLIEKLIPRPEDMGEGVAEAKGGAGPEGVVAAEAVGKEVGFAVESHVEDAAVLEASDNVEVEKGEKNMEETSTEDGLEGRKQRFRDQVEESSVAGVGKGVAVIRWIYKMLDLGFNEKSIRKICDYCEFFCFMPKGYGEQVANLVGAIVRARSKKLSAEEFTLSIYAAVDAVGVKVDSKELSSLILNVLEKDKSEGCVKCASFRP